MTDQPPYVRLPRAPITKSRVPGLTSLYYKDSAGPYGDRRYPGNCGGELIKDLLRYFRPRSVFDPMSGSGTCRQVCAALSIRCVSSDLRQGFDACDSSNYPQEKFDFIWLHPPYWRQQRYGDDPRDLAQAPTLDAFLERYQRLIENCTQALAPGGKLVILMGDYTDREAGFIPLTYHTKRLGFACGLRQPCTDIVRFSYGARSGKKQYQSAFIPGLHDMCIILEKPRQRSKEPTMLPGGVTISAATEAKARASSNPESGAVILDTINLGTGAGMELARNCRDSEMQIRFVFAQSKERPPQAVTQALKEAGWAWNRDERCWIKHLDSDTKHVSQVEAERLFRSVAARLQSQKQGTNVPRRDFGPG